MTDRGADRTAGILIGLGAVLGMVAALHHPVLNRAHGASPVQVGDALGHLAPMLQFIHGLLMLVFAAQAVGFVVFARRLDLGRISALAGLVFYLLSVVVMIIPATIDGFIIPLIAARCSGGVCGTGLFDQVGLVFTFVQAFTRVALAAQAVAILCWGWTLVSGKGSRRLAGGFGLMVGAGSAIVLGLMNHTIRAPDLMPLMAGQALWSLLAAGLLLTGNAAAPSSGGGLTKQP